MTLIVNLYGGPATGKSTIAAGVFHELKKEGKSVELVPEFAKDLTWEKRTTALRFQPYVIGKQMYRCWRLLGEVDVIVTDSPILLGWHYADPQTTPPGFYDMVREYHDMWDTLDIMLTRDLRFYTEEGRNQTKEEAFRIDNDLKTILAQVKSPYITLRVDHTTVGAVWQAIYDRMNWEY